MARVLTGLARLTAPDAGERERMRQRILAGLAAEDTAPVRPTPKPSRSPRPGQPPGHRAPDSSTRAPRSRRPGELPGATTGARGRFAIASVALLALVFSLTGMSLLLARDALPGDALYGVKRTAESASLGLTFGDESKALKHLEFASARMSEIETLAQRYPNPAEAPAGGYLTALSDFDNDAASGSRQLIALATRNDGRQLEALRSWSAQQAERLAEVATRLPGAAHNRQGASLALLNKIAARSAALLDRMQCYQITSGSYDDVGALPANNACERVPGAGSAATPLPDGGSSTQPGSPGGGPAPQVTTVPQPTGPTPGAPPDQTPQSPPLLPGVPPTGTRPLSPVPPTTDGQPPTVVVPLPLPTIDVPPLLFLPGIRVGT